MEETQKVKETISNIISDRLTNMLESMSNEEFIDEVCTELEISDSISEEEREKLKELVGNQVLPLLHKISEYFVENHHSINK